MRGCGASYSKAIYWRRRPSAELDAAQEVSLVEVAVDHAEPSSGAEITVELRCGRRLSVPSTMPASELQYLIGAIESC